MIRTVLFLFRPLNEKFLVLSSESSSIPFYGMVVRSSEIYMPKDAHPLIFDEISRINIAFLFVPFCMYIVPCTYTHTYIYYCISINDIDF